LDNLTQFHYVLILILFSLGFQIYNRFKRGFSRDLAFNVILVVDFVFGVYGFQYQQSYNKAMAAWISVGIFLAAVVTPYILTKFITFFVAKANWKWAGKFLQAKHLLQPSIHVSQQIIQLDRLQKAHQGDISELSSELEREISKSGNPLQQQYLREKLIELYVFAAKYEEALKLYDREIVGSKYPSQPTLLLAVARAGAELGEYHRIWISYLQLLKMKNGTIELQQAKYSLQTIILAFYGRSKVLKKILSPLKKSNLIFPVSKKLYFMGISYLTQGKLEKAKEYLELPDKEKYLNPILNELSKKRISEEFVSPPKLTKELKSRLKDIEKQVLKVFEFSSVKSLFPFATLTFILFTSAIYLFQIIASSSGNGTFIYQLGGNVWELTKNGDYYRLFTAMFIHANFFHFGMNMFVLWLLGRLVEPHYGYYRTISILIFSGIAGNILSAYTHNYPGYSIGASSAVFGILGSGIIMLSIYKHKFPKTVRKQLLNNFIFMLIINFLIGFSIKVIDNSAHMGGFVGGIAISLVLGSYFKSSKFKNYFAYGFCIFTILSLVFSTYKVYMNFSGDSRKTFTEEDVSIEFNKFEWSIRTGKNRKTQNKFKFLQSVNCTISPTLTIDTMKPENYNENFQIETEKNILKNQSFISNVKLIYRKKFKKWKEIHFTFDFKKIKSFDYVFFRKYNNKIKKITITIDEKCKKIVLKGIYKMIENAKFINSN
jgi:membrane associated rhomboid family serine protease